MPTPINDKCQSRMNLHLVLVIFSILFSSCFYLIWCILPKNSNDQNTVALLNYIYKQKCPLDSRISQAEYISKTSNCEDKYSQIDSIELKRIEEQLLKNAAIDPNAENLHISGKFYLITGNFYSAIKELEAAEKINSNSAQIQNDLGVAYLELSLNSQQNKTGDSLINMGKAFAKFDAAMNLDPNQLEAYFNLATALQKMNLQNQAKEAFQTYLTIDPDSVWAIDIKTNLKKFTNNKQKSKTSEELIKDFLQAYRNQDNEKAYKIVSNNREMIKSKLIPQKLTLLFLKSVGEPQKRDYLEALNYIGDLEKERTGDIYFSDIAKFYDSVEKKDTKILLSAQKAVERGYELALLGKYNDALFDFTKAQKLFLKVDNIWEAKLSEYWIAYCEFQIGNIQKSTERLEILLNYCKTNNFKWLASHTNYWLSINSQAMQELSRSIEFANDSLKLSEETNDFYNTQKSLSRLADLHLQVNQFQKSYFYLKKSLEMSNFPQSSIRQKGRDFDVATRLFYTTKYYNLAGYYQKEVLDLYSTELKDASFEHIGLANLGNIYAAQGKFDEALKFAEKGKKISETLADVKAKQKAVGYAILQIANLNRKKGACDIALNNYQKAINIFGSLELKSLDFEAKRGRLLCNLENNNSRSIDNELPEILNLFEENRIRITEEENRNSFFDKEQDIYDLAIDYEISKGNIEKAFDYSEKSRSRSLLDLIKSRVILSADKKELKIEGVEEPKTFSEIRSQIPLDVQIIQYAVLDNKIIIWLFTRNKLETFTSEISNDILDDNISEFLNSIKNKDQAKQQKLSRKFFKILIEPLENKLDISKELFIIPDKKLFYLPFAALISNKTNKYLIEDFNVAYSPSTNVFLLTTKKALEKDSKTIEKLLSIGNPTFSTDNSKGLPNLPFSAKEAKEITGFYHNPILLLEKKATKAALIKDMKNADIIHFAGHYIINEHSPLRSSFLVALSEKSNRLANYELLENKLDKPKLIVLSACQTAIEQYYKGEGMTGAGRTFLALGIPLIVASQWQVDDVASAELMENFHKYRKKQKLSSISSLRKAQLEMLNSKNEKFREPYYWGGFLTLGGHANY